MTITTTTTELLHLLKRANRQLIMRHTDAALATYNQLLSTSIPLCGNRARFTATAHLGRAAVALFQGDFVLADDEMGQASMIFANLGEDERNQQAAQLAIYCDAALYDADATAIQKLLDWYRSTTRHLCTPIDETIGLVAYSALEALYKRTARAS